ncbi:hypothetical protein VCHE16_2949 [Vibrio paracholerae HE-16]|nr:hypothetical protein VCHE16_2949 [Vibrio paracholerae HE-16]
MLGQNPFITVNRIDTLLLNIKRINSLIVKRPQQWPRSFSEQSR